MQYMLTSLSKSQPNTKKKNIKSTHKNQSQA